MGWAAGATPMIGYRLEPRSTREVAGMGGATRQANFTLPQDLLDELRRTVPKGEQSRLVGEALRNELRRLRFRKALEESFGAWRASRHPELAGGTRRFLRSLRRSSRVSRLKAT